MKSNIHPTYHNDAKVVCANCNNTFTTGATQEELRIEICSACHPFYTGKKTLIDTEGRVDKFKNKMEAATGRTKKKRGKKTLEERVNLELEEQLKKEKAKAEKEAQEKAEKKAA